MFQWVKCKVCTIFASLRCLRKPQKMDHPSWREIGQEVQRKPYDGKVISVDTRDKGRTEALYGVRSRLVHGFSAFDIASDLFPSRWAAWSLPFANG